MKKIVYHFLIINFLFGNSVCNQTIPTIPRQSVTNRSNSAEKGSISCKEISKDTLQCIVYDSATNTYKVINERKSTVTIPGKGTITIPVPSIKSTKQMKASNK